jgi:hypothetical protein
MVGLLLLAAAPAAGQHAAGAGAATTRLAPAPGRPAGAGATSARLAPAALAPQVAALDVPPVRTPAPADAWLGSDKFRHFWVSFAATAYGFGAARAAGAETGDALYIAVPVAGAVGLGKEIHDLRRGGIFSVRDLVADGLGIAVAWLVLREVR